MKTIALMLLLFVPGLCSWAQIFPNKPYVLLYHFGANLDFAAEDITRNHVKSITGAGYDVRNKKEVPDGSDFKAVFDRQGNPTWIAYTQYFREKELQQFFNSFRLDYDNKNRLTEFETFTSVRMDTTTYKISFGYEGEQVSRIQFHYRSSHPSPFGDKLMEVSEQNYGIQLFYASGMVEKVVRWQPQGYHRLRYDTLPCRSTFDSLTRLNNERKDITVVRDSLGRISRIHLNRIAGSAKPMGGPCEFFYTPYLSFQKIYDDKNRLTQMRVYNTKKMLNTMYYSHHTNGLVNEIEETDGKKTLGGNRYTYTYYVD